MHVLVTGAAGMIGRKLVARLCNDKALNGVPIETLTLADIDAPCAPAGFSGKAELHAVDLSSPGNAERVIAARPDVIFHLAGVVSGEAETDFEKGYRVNLDGSRALLEAIRKTGDGYCPKFIFTSSIAVYGTPLPEIIPDDFHLTPHTSYGAQKVMVEAMLSDYTRRGFIEGIGIRLPGITVRPGQPNKAASGFFSAIIREPLAGLEAVQPVSDDVKNTHASPRAAAGFLVHAASLSRTQIGPNVNLVMPGICCSVGEQKAALRRIAGERVAARIRHVPDPFIMEIVAGWPQSFAARRAQQLGFRAENTFDEIISIHIEEELNGHFVA